MFQSPIIMPGSFLDHEPASMTRSTATPSFFIPPSPSASSALSQSYTSIPRPISSHSHTRKRPRLNSQSRNTTPRPTYRQQHSTSTFGEPSPAPLVNCSYRIAGGLDTPTTEKLRQEEHSQFEYEQDLRPSRFTPRKDDHDCYFPQTPSRTENVKRPVDSGWSRTVWTYTGGFAGKVFNFCWNTAFHGFHAGGGKGYHMHVDTPVVTADGESVGQENVFDAAYRERSPVPGGFPEQNFIEDYMLRPESHQDDQTPTQVNEIGGSSLKSNWVMVDNPSNDADQSPARKRARSTAQISSRPSSRASLVRPRLQAARSSHGASFASPRASLAGTTHSRPQSSDGPDRQHKRSKSSIASPRRSEFGTPNSPDVIKFEKKMRRQNQRQDDSIRKLNQQMQDMIKEAQQALGSKVEVVDEVEDEGYEEGTESSSGWSSGR